MCVIVLRDGRFSLFFLTFYPKSPISHHTAVTIKMGSAKKSTLEKKIKRTAMHDHIILSEVVSSLITL